MPELPEVETVKRGLEVLIVHKKVAQVTCDNEKSFPNDEASAKKFLISAEVISVRRRAKVLLIDLSSDYSLMIHLKMTGQLVFRGKESFGAGHPNDSLVNKLPDRTTRVIFEFNDGSLLYFNDQRKFGWVKLLPTIEIQNVPFIQKLGPEPLTDDFTAEILYERLQRRKNTSIKAAILDQTVLAGVGNIYADEALWGARIHPTILVKNLNKKQVTKLYEEIRYVMNLSIEKGGSTDRNYVNAEGKKGSYIDFARVFRREGQACKECGNEIIKTRVAGRGTHVCEFCQKV
jgi:formamidopyrimidine-DNA glycosylase